MALVDTQGFTVAVDRSLFGPQGRRWIEKKLPEVVTNLSFIAVSGFGACLLMYQVCKDYSENGLWALGHLPKHLANGVMLHVVARLLRWHIDRLVMRSFLPRAETPLPNFFGRSGGGRQDSASAVVWPWQADTAPRRQHQSQPLSTPPPRRGSGLRAEEGLRPFASSGGDTAADEAVRASSIPPASNSKRRYSDGTGGGGGGGGGTGGGGDDDEGDGGGGEAAAAASLRLADHMASDGDEPRSGLVPEEGDVAESRGFRQGSGGRGDGGGAWGWSPNRSGSGAGAGNKDGTPGYQSEQPRPAGLSVARVLRSRRPQRMRRAAHNEQRLTRANYFVEEDVHELLSPQSMFFIKMCDDSSWLYVEDELHEPEWGWALQLFHRGYGVSVRYPGEVKQSDAPRMLFTCEPGRHEGHVRIRSRATDTFLFFLGLRPPLTLVAWDRDVMGGDWEDMKLVWLNRGREPTGGDDSGRVIVRSRALHSFVTWNGTRFVHTRSKESATVFMLQRMTTAGGGSPAGAAAGGPRL